MRDRYLAQPVSKLAFGNNRMAFVSGPRQCGKTTLANMLGERRRTSRYFNWDDVEFRKIWNQSPKSIVPASADTPLVILDEIHKERLWKRTLKGVYDTLAAPCDFLVTGSARLNVYRRGSDSLLGRYFHFLLAPFSLREMFSPEAPRPDEAIEALFSRASTRSAWISKNHMRRSDSGSTGSGNSISCSR